MDIFTQLNALEQVKPHLVKFHLFQVETSMDTYLYEIFNEIVEQVRKTTCSSYDPYGY